MKLISYDGRVYITDGNTKRYVPSPAVMADLLKITGQSSSLGVSKATHDWLRNDELADIVTDVGKVSAQVETVRRFLVDTHPNPYPTGA